MSNSLRQSQEYSEDSFNEPDSWAPELLQYGISRNGVWTRGWAPGCNEYASQGDDQLEFDVSGRNTARACNQGVMGRRHPAYDTRSRNQNFGPGRPRRDFMHSGDTAPSAEAMSPTEPVGRDFGIPASADPAADLPSIHQQRRATSTAHSRARRRTGTWSDDTLAAAIAAVDAGGKLRTVGRDFGIPASSLRDHVHGKILQRKKGRQGVLTAKEETDLVTWMLSMQDHAHPISVQELRIKVTEITQER